MSEPYHFSPDVFGLLVKTVPLLVRSKRAVLGFFAGAGAHDAVLADLAAQLEREPERLNKYQLAETILTRLNAGGDTHLRARREVVRRVVEFDNFSALYEDNQIPAKGYVAELRELVDGKDYLTRLRQVGADVRRARQATLAVRREQEQAERERIRRDLVALTAMTDAQARGKALEGVVNRLFAAAGLLVREAFTLTAVGGAGVVEQIDGAIEFDGALYLVEMKWWNKPLGPGDVGQHLVRCFSRSEVRGLFISASGYTAAAIAECQRALRDRVIVLCTLAEVAQLLEQAGDLRQFLTAKVQQAILNQNPFYQPLAS